MKFSEVRLNARNKSAGATEPQQRINVKTLAHEFSFIIIPYFQEKSNDLKGEFKNFLSNSVW